MTIEEIVFEYVITIYMVMCVVVKIMNHTIVCYPSLKGLNV